MVKRVSFTPLVADDIALLAEPNTLFVSDFRSLTEDPSWIIPEIWKYENLIQWIVRADHSSVCLASQAIADVAHSRLKPRLINVELGDDPRVAIIDRLTSRQVEEITPGLTRVWTACANEASDRFAAQHGLELNCSAGDFAVLNDKLTQKLALSPTLTPRWRQVEAEDLGKSPDLFDSSFVKHRSMSGGFGVFQPQLFPELLSGVDISNWYIEDLASGQSYSVQIVVEDESAIVFGYSRQLISDGRFYEGSELFCLDEMPKRVQRFVVDVLEGLSPMLATYSGFLGIDFVDDLNNVMFLEANVRLTSATVPTLLFNASMSRTAMFRESVVSTGDSSDRSIILTRAIDNSEDRLVLGEQNNAFGTSVLGRLENCVAIPATLDLVTIEQLATIVERHVGRIVESAHHNFWPYGWTISFVLSESHATFSAWYVEKAVLVDAFSCGKLSSSRMSQELIELLGGSWVECVELSR